MRVIPTSSTLVFCAILSCALALQTPLPPRTGISVNQKASATQPSSSLFGPKENTEEGLKGLLKNERNLKNNHVAPTLWTQLTQKAKDDVKAWFIQRGNKKGVPFGETVDFFRSNFDAAQANYELVHNPNIRDYKSYYTQTFHGYETGNLSWEAAEDCLGATLSMSMLYWPRNHPLESASWFRGNFTRALTQYCEEVSPLLLSNKIKKKNTAFAKSSSSSSLQTLDVAGSIGVSTKVLLDEFPNAKVGLVDLSPYFLSTAKMLLETHGSPIYDASAVDRVSYQHAYAEDMPYASNSIDIVTVSFLLHELPPPVTRQVMGEAYRVLKPGGVLAILDLDAATVRSLAPLRRFLFEVSEPHIHQYASPKTDVHHFLQDAGFQHTKYEMNDPMNARWMGRKPDSSSELPV